uniref:Ribonuclease H-like domain-containing protein n=1 Tax=Tanacetum cinerariifolium TaxID=118510 RepID=A0A699J622_TANCI|nr:ribonuclease H-like domain-containing protein [Tanacetum cinerariifolium]
MLKPQSIIVGFQGLHGITTAQLVLLVYKKLHQLVVVLRLLYLLKLLQRKNKLKVKSTLLLAILDGHLLNFMESRMQRPYGKQLRPAEIKGQSSSSLNSQNVAFVSSDHNSSTNKAVNTAHSVFAASSQGQASTSTYADDVMFCFFANQSNSPQLDNEDLEQIDTDDLDEMDLKWQVAMLTMRVKRFIKKTKRNLNFNGKETVGFDKTKVEYYNCYRRGHFARECKAPRSQRNRNGDNTRRVIPVETPANALVVTDMMGYD